MELNLHAVETSLAPGNPGPGSLFISTRFMKSNPTLALVVYRIHASRHQAPVIDGWHAARSVYFSSPTLGRSLA